MLRIAEVYRSGATADSDAAIEPGLAVWVRDVLRANAERAPA